MQKLSMDALWRQTDAYIPPALIAEGGLVLLRARLLITFCWLFVITAVFALIPSVLRPETMLFEVGFFGCFALLAAAGPPVLRRTGKTAVIGLAISVVGVAAAIAGAVWMEGIFSASVVWVAALPLLSAFLMGSGTTIPAIIASTVVFCAVASLHAMGLHTVTTPALLVHRVVNLTSLTVFCAIIARLHEWSAAQARASEQEALQLFQVVSSRMGVGTILVEGGVIRLANAAAEQLLGHLVGTLDGEPWSHALPPEVDIDITGASTSREFDLDAAVGLRRVAVRADTIDGPRGPAKLVTLVDITERWQMEQQQLAAQSAIAQSLDEKETLIKEIHHRVKNNLQIISSLLMLQSAQMPDDRGRDLLQESVYRVRSMSLIHEQLYGMESLARIDFGEYARSLSGSLVSALAPTPRIRVESPSTPIELTIEMAVPLGLILNELITNAIKYGRRIDVSDGGRIGSDCDVLVEISRDGDTLVVAVADAGPGLADGIDVKTSKSLGLQLVRSLARQIRCRFTVDCKQGTRFEVRGVLAPPQAST
jgi:two-component sensor histidine kinase/PAS domain-containing protein